MFDAETRRHGDLSSRVALLRFIWAVWFAAHPVGWRTMMRWLILSFHSCSGCFDCSACFSRAALMRSSSLQALKKARSRRHCTCVIRPNMAARALGRGSAPGRPGAARLVLRPILGLESGEDFVKVFPIFVGVAQRSWKQWPCPGSFLDLMTCGH